MGEQGMNINVSLKYAVEKEIWHQRAYHTFTHYFKNKRQVQKHIKELGNEETLIRVYEIQYRKLK